MIMTADKRIIAFGGGIPSCVLDKGVVSSQVHRHRPAASWTAGDQFGGDAHADRNAIGHLQPFLRCAKALGFHHLTDDFLVIISLMVTKRGALPQAIITLGVEEAALVKSSALKTVIHIGGEDEIVFIFY